GVKVVLIPKPVLLLRRRRFNRPGDVVNVVAVSGDEAEYALRPEHGDDAGGAPAPVVAGEHGAPDCERVDELLEVVAERRLLARAQRVGGEEAGRTIAAQIRHDHPGSG